MNQELHESERKDKFTGPYWNYKANLDPPLDTVVKYKASFREPPGFFRGARIS